MATVPCYTFLESSRRASVTPRLTCNGVILRITVFRYSRSKFEIFGTHANFHADRCHCRRDICNRTDSLDDISDTDKTRTGIAFVDNNKSKSLKIIGTCTIRKLGCGFLFAFHNNYGSILYHFRDKVIYWSKIAIFSHRLHKRPR